MSITDELREWALGIGVTQDSKIWALADNIDAAHRSALEKLAAQVDESGALPMTDENMAEHGWVRLPVDADGVPIRVGDVMEWVTYDDTYESVIRTVDGVGIDVFFAWSNDRAGHAQYEAQAYRHHHATVEDVLDELFGKANLPDGTQTRAEIIAEYAAKLRLAERVEQ